MVTLIVNSIVFMETKETESLAFFIFHLSLTQLMVSHDLLRLTVTNQIAIDERDSKSISNFERAMLLGYLISVTSIYRVSQKQNARLLS